MADSDAECISFAVGTNVALVFSFAVRLLKSREDVTTDDCDDGRQRNKTDVSDTHHCQQRLHRRHDQSVFSQSSGADSVCPACNMLPSYSLVLSSVHTTRVHGPWTRLSKTMPVFMGRALNKCSAVAETGDRLAADMGRTVGGCCAPFWGHRRRSKAEATTGHKH